jgi:hypothetical protein
MAPTSGDSQVASGWVERTAANARDDANGVQLWAKLAAGDTGYGSLGVQQDCYLPSQGCRSAQQFRRAR